MSSLAQTSGLIIRVTLLIWNGKSCLDKRDKMTERGIKEERRWRHTSRILNDEICCISWCLFTSKTRCQCHLVSHGSDSTPSPTDHSFLLHAFLCCSFISNHAPSPFLSEYPTLPFCFPLAVLLIWSFF